MKKILFVGKFNTVFQTLSRYFEKYFKVQVCADNADMVKGMLEKSTPDMVVLCCIGLEAGYEQITDELKNRYPLLPVICYGTDEELDCVKKYTDTPQFTRVVRPVEYAKVLDIMCRILNVEYEEGRIVDRQDRRKRILLVDDSAIQLRALHDLLKEKYDVRMATSGMQALTMIGKQVPDVIFLDYEMPVCDGKMTLEMIRELEETKDTPVVFLTGVNDKEHIESVLQLKPSGYLLKPASADKIYSTLDRLFMS